MDIYERYRLFLEKLEQPHQQPHQQYHQQQRQRSVLWQTIHLSHRAWLVA